MLIQTPEHLSDEIAAAITAWTGPLRVRRNILQSYAGEAMLDAERRCLENPAHEYISLVVPKLVAVNPKVSVTSRMRTQRAMMAARTMESGIDRWVADTQHVRFLERMASDFLTSWGVALVTLEKVAGWTDSEDVTTRPVVVPLDAENVLWDPAALTWETKRWIGWKYAIDAEDAEELAKDDPRWDLKALQDCAVDVGLESLQADGGKNSPKRKQIVIWEVYVPDAKVDDGENGAVFTLSCGATGAAPRFLREAMAFYGPAGGPCVLFGAYLLPRRSIPMSPLMATWQTVDEINRHASALSDAAGSYKRIGVADGLKPADAEKIANARDGSVQLIAGFTKDKYLDVELGGLTDQRIGGYQMVRSRWERTMALDEAKSGRASPNATATAIAVASESSQLRIAWLADKFRAADEAVLRIVAWYMHEERSVVMPVEGEGGRPALFRGGAETGEKFDFLELEIERYSMERTTQESQQRRALALAEFTTKVLPMYPSLAPFVDVKQLTALFAEYMQAPEIEDIVSPEQAVAVFNAQLRAESPQFAGDVSPEVRKGEAGGGGGRQKNLNGYPGQETGQDAKQEAA